MTTPITDALQASEEPLAAPSWLLWRVGEDGRSIYAMPTGLPQDTGDLRVGRMVDEALALEAVHAHNNTLRRVQAQTDGGNLQ